jgi:hypothetical protein
MRLVGLLLALVVVSLLGTKASGADAIGTYTVVETTACANFVTTYSGEMDARKRNGMGAGKVNTWPYATDYNYVAGWLSAFNFLTPDTVNILPNGVEGAMLWLNNYCNSHPLVLIDAGLDALVREAYPMRKN